MQRVQDFGSFVLYSFLERPLRLLYFDGPSYGNYGFWNGVSNAEICASLTKTNSMVWLTTSETIRECGFMVNKAFTSFYVLVTCLIYFYFLVTFLRGMWVGIPTLLMNRFSRKQVCKKYVMITE